MRLGSATATVALLASSVAAQRPYQTGPLYLLITSPSDSSINGHTTLCHSGAAQAGLCYLAGAPFPADEGVSIEFYFNTSTPVTDDDDNGLAEGTLSSHALVSPNVSTSPSGVYLYGSRGSKVAALWAKPAAEAAGGGGGMFMMGIDDKEFGAEDPPGGANSDARFFTWVVCHTYVGSYYMRSLAWMSGDGPARNPTCVGVEVVMQLVG